LDHPNIVTFLGISIIDECELCLVTELMSQGSLRSVLKGKSRHLPWKLRLRILKGAAKGM
jgi:serine/threonine protein kinase